MSAQAAASDVLVLSRRTIALFAVMSLSLLFLASVYFYAGGCAENGAGATAVSSDRQFAGILCFMAGLCPAAVIFFDGPGGVFVRLLRGVAFYAFGLGFMLVYGAWVPWGDLCRHAHA